MFLLLFIYLISPLVFIPLFIVELNKNKKLNKRINEILTYQHQNTTIENNQNISTDKTDEEVIKPPPLNNPTYNQHSKTQYNSPYTLPTGYDMPSQQQYQRPIPQIPAPQATFIQNEHPKTSTPVNTASIIMIIGVAFVILSGIIFATATWAFLPSFLRAVVISSFSVVFILSSCCEIYCSILQQILISVLLLPFLYYFQT